MEGEVASAISKFKQEKNCRSTMYIYAASCTRKRKKMMEKVTKKVKNAKHKKKLI